MEKAWLELAKNFETLLSVERFLLNSSKKSLDPDQLALAAPHLAE
jgi:hypothetical protein